MTLLMSFPSSTYHLSPKRIIGFIHLDTPIIFPNNHLLSMLIIYWFNNLKKKRKQYQPICPPLLHHPHCLSTTKSLGRKKIVSTHAHIILPSMFCQAPSHIVVIHVITPITIHDPPLSTMANCPSTIIIPQPSSSFEPIVTIIVQEYYLILSQVKLKNLPIYDLDFFYWND